MVTLSEQYRKTAKESETWWAWSPAQGWVVLDKTLPQNKCSDLPEDMRFVRCQDWKAYEQGDATWNYREAGRYLDTLPPGKALKAVQELEGLQAQFEKIRYEVA